MSDPTKIPIRATTQEHLDIEDIQEDLVILKDGSVCLVLQTSAVNFGLLSEQEQDATIFAYAGLLNSLTFPIQIVIKSQQKDVSSYLKLLKNEEDKQKNPALKERIYKYRLFIESTVRENNVLDKKFFIVIPFSSIELGIKSSGNFFKKGLPFPKSYILERAKTALFPKRDHLIRQFNRLGLKAVQLNTKQLIELFFKTYNPDSIGTQTTVETEEYTKPIVEAALESPIVQKKPIVEAALPNQPSPKPTIEEVPKNPAIGLPETPKNNAPPMANTNNIPPSTNVFQDKQEQKNPVQNPINNQEKVVPNSTVFSPFQKSPIGSINKQPTNNPQGPVNNNFQQNQIKPQVPFQNQNLPPQNTTTNNNQNQNKKSAWTVEEIKPTNQNPIIDKNNIQ